MWLLVFFIQFNLKICLAERQILGYSNTDFEIVATFIQALL